VAKRLDQQILLRRRAARVGGIEGLGVAADDFLSAWRLTAQDLKSADDAIEEHARRLTIRLNGDDSSPELVRRLQAALEPYRRGRCQVAVLYRTPAAEAELTLGESWSVRPTRELREQLVQLVGENEFSIHYQKHII
jgi:DNA polymerase-3 subunit alpha